MSAVDPAAVAAALADVLAEQPTAPRDELPAWWRLLADLYDLRARSGFGCRGVHALVLRGDYEGARRVLDQLLDASSAIVHTRERLPPLVIARHS